MNMKIVAVIAVRNGKHYIKNLIQHLETQMISYVFIDNDSTDSTITKINKYKGKGLIDVYNLDHEGYFCLTSQLQLKEKIYDELDADWLIH
jgi:glycosyltransferase involved in cell wall biosynthesis